MARKTSGGNSQPVFAITSNDLEQNGGQYKLITKTAIPVQVIAPTSRRSSGELAMPVYPVTADQINTGGYELDGGAAVAVMDATTFAPSKKKSSSKWATPVYVVGGSL